MNVERAETAGPVQAGDVAVPAGAWSDVRDQLRARGLRWTPQRRLILDVLGATTGHVTGSEIVERCRAKDPETTPSTVYRPSTSSRSRATCTSHGADGREEFHVLPHAEHAHLRCDRCNGSWEVATDEAMALVEGLERSRGFRVHIGHLTVTGVCADCGRAGRRA